VARAPVLHDPEHAREDLLADAVIQEDHAVGDVLFEALPRQRPLATLRGDDGGDVTVLEPLEEPAQLRPDDGEVLERGEEDLERIEGDPFRFHRIDSVAEPEEQPLEVVFPILLDLERVDLDVVDDELALLDERVQVVTERADVLAQVLGALLQREDDARLAITEDAAHHELDSHERLAASGTARDERGAAAWQPALCDLIETVDAGGTLLQTGERWVGGELHDCRRHP
jgi:hypothetical protein